MEVGSRLGQMSNVAVKSREYRARIWMDKGWLESTKGINLSWLTGMPVIMPGADAG